MGLEIAAKLVALTLFFLMIWYIWTLVDVKSYKSVGVQGMEGRVGASMTDILKFFDVSDASEVTWAHAVNSQEKLQEALAGEVMMIEADVLLRDDDGIPIMAHPPSTDSDLSLVEFVKAVLATRKGIKLDFKTTAVVEPSLKILWEEMNSLHQHTSTPVWLNADILLGPCRFACSAVHPHIFLSLCTKFFPSATLSVGWRTDFYLQGDDHYEWPMVQQMKDLLAKINQPVTFPVRAKIIGKSMEQMLWLLSLSNNYTLTIWSTTFDDPNTKDLVALHRKVADKKRLFYDLPVDQHTKFLEELKFEA